MPGATPNPFSKSGTQDSVTAALYTSKNIAEELRRDDAAMAADLTALAPNSSRSYNVMTRARNSLGGRRPTSNRSREDAAATFMEVQDTVTTDAFLTRKREVGLVRMSLATKRTEIRKLEEEIDRAEKRLRQQQDQLENTREKFNSFLKHSNLEQDAAVRRADNETKAKLETVVEIKKLSANIGHVELEIRKTEVQLDSCKMYKKFLDDLTKPVWFYEVLTGFRVADRTEEILLEAEDAYNRRCEELRAEHVIAVAAREAQEKESAHGYSSQQRHSLMSGEDLLPLVPIEEQIEKLHKDMEIEAQTAIADYTEATKQEINDMSLEQVKETLESMYDESRIPMHFKAVEELLEVFINVEEGNLFLIQNCQELEEELEGVAMSYMNEKADMTAMMSQRQAQMNTLSDKIRQAQEKLHQLDERASALDRSSNQAATTNGNGPNTKGSASGKPQKKESQSVADLPPEMFKDRVESSIASIFRTLTGGDNTIKQLTAQLQRAQQKKAQLQAMAEAGSDDDDVGGLARDESRRSMTLTGSKQKNSTVRSASQSKPKPKRKRKTSHDSGKAHSPHDPSINETVNIGSLEMLTIVENKLEEYHRYITDPANGVDEALIISVMKASDKERRRQARLLHLANQELEQEEKSRKALERSQAPVVRRTGKPVLRRSRLVREDDLLEKGASSAYDAEKDGDEFFA